MAYPWSEAYNKGWGKPGKWSSKGKAKKGPRKGDWWDEAAEEPQEAQVRTGRIWSRYQFPKAILKASAGQDGSAFVKDAKRNISDDLFLGTKHLKALLTADSTHVLRRPGVGISEAAGSVQAGVDVLGALADVELEELASIFHDPDFNAALAQLNTTDTSAQHDNKDLRAAVALLFKKLTKTPRLAELVTKVTIASSRLHLMGTALLPLLVCASDPAWWVSHIPDTVSDSANVKAWRKHSNDTSRMHKALATLLTEKLEEDSRDRGNTASSLFKKKPPVREAASASPTGSGGTSGSSSPTSSPSRGKKAKAASRKPKTAETKKPKKGPKADKSDDPDSIAVANKKKKDKRKAEKSDDPDSITVPKKKKKDKEAQKAANERQSPSPASDSCSKRRAAKDVALEIYRVTAVSGAGKAMVTEGSPVDKVEVIEDGETVASAVRRLFEAQGSQADVANWDIRAMDEDQVIREIQPDVTLARECSKVVLVRKGG
ncbi:unnamed protein product [Symbiodinium sp. CCMP2592]|nr:unnamed protein product [Symbiodinium sp. CCMP2592]